MRIAFKPLFRIRLRHSFYATGHSVRDFAVEPGAATRRTLSDHGLVFRRLADGCAVYGEVEPGSDPLRLLRPLGDDALRLTFLLQPANPYLLNISELPEHRPGRSVFYFNNLRDDQEGGDLHLGDSVADARVGDAIRLVTGETCTYRFASPVHDAVLVLFDLFDNTVFATSFSLPDPAATTSEYRLDLRQAGHLVPGRYTLRDDRGGGESFYYDPEIFANRPFGAIEIFSRTDVAPAYRFLSGDQLLGVRDYVLRIESRATRWRYHVVKKYSANGFPLDALAISGEIAFHKIVDAERAIFTSTVPVPLSERRQALALQGEDGSPVRNLPNPAADTPLQADAAPGSFISEMYVYV